MPSTRKINSDAKKAAQAEINALIERASKAGFSMLKVCRSAGVHHDTFGRWRRGQRLPMYTTLQKLSATLTDLIAAKARK